MLTQKNSLFDLMLSQSSLAKIKDIDKLTLDLIGMLELYGDTKNLPWAYVEKRGVYNIIEQARSVQALDSTFREWIIKHRMAKGKNSNKGFKADELNLSDQLYLIKTLESDVMNALNMILRFASADEKKHLSTVSSLKESMIETEWGKYHTDGGEYRMRYRDYSHSDGHYSDWFSYRKPEEITYDLSRRNYSYKEAQTRKKYQPGYSDIPSEFNGYNQKFITMTRTHEYTAEYLTAKAQAEAAYEKAMKKCEEDMQFYEEHKNMLDHPPAKPEMEEVEVKEIFNFYLELTEEGKKIYNLINDYIRKVQTNKYSGTSSESELDTLPKRPNYREALEKYLGQTVTLKCDNYSVSEENGHKTIIGRNIKVVDKDGNVIDNSEINHMYFFVEDSIETFNIPVKLNITGTIVRYKYNEQMNLGLIPQTLWFTIQ